MVERKTVFQTKDGDIFDNEKEATQHETLLDFSEWYEENKLYGNTPGCRMEWEDLIEWLQNNKKEIQSILKLI